MSLDEYILFIENCCYSRVYDLDLPTIDWEKVREGIRERIKYLTKSDEKDNAYRKIRDENKKNFTENEWSSYQIIKEFRDNDIWLYEKNQKLYIELISSDLQVAFRDLSNKNYNTFSLEMESATINAFKNADNEKKNIFPGWFTGVWRQYIDSTEIDRQATMISFKKLREDLNFVMQEYKGKKKNIAVKYTQNFIEELDALISASGCQTPGTKL